MRSLIVLLALGLGVSARPGLLEPSGSYIPSVAPSGSYLPSVGSTVFDSSIGVVANALGGSGYNDFVGGYSNINAGYAGGFIGANQHQVQKHVYFYAAPDDEPASRLRVYVEPASQRNTKVIFIKAPSSGGVIPEVIAPPSEAIDRTKVYVLVKKQQHDAAVSVPAPLSYKQAPPEVYYVKYRNQHEADQLVNQGLHGGSVGAPLENLGNEQVFARTLSGGHTGHIGLGAYSSISAPRGFSASNVGYTTALTGEQTIGTVVGSGTGVVSAGTRYGVPGESGPYKKK